MLNPHKYDPFVVFGYDNVPWTHLDNERTNSYLWRSCTINELLSEPKDKWVWMSSLYARLLIASTGPLYEGNANEKWSRLEKSGWTRVPQDVNLYEARKYAWPAIEEVQKTEGGIGSLAPKLFIVGEKDSREYYPLFTKSGAVLWAALRELGYDELGCYVINALDFEKNSRAESILKLHDAFAKYEPIYISLGSVADELLNSYEIKHIKSYHPNFILRSNNYIRKSIIEMRNCLLDAGLKALADSPLVTSECITSSLAENVGLPSRMMFATAANESGSKGVNLKKLTKADIRIIEKARIKYVLGEFATVKESAESVSKREKIIKTIISMSKQQNWDGERLRYFEQRREKLKESVSESEAKSISDSRKLAWENLSLMLQKLNKDIISEELAVLPRDVKAIGELAMHLAEQGDPSAELEAKKLKQLPPSEIAKQYLKQMEENYKIEEGKKNE